MLKAVEEALAAAETTQHEWADRVARKRLQVIGSVPQQIINSQLDLLAAIRRPNSSDAEQAASELLPLADACRYATKVGRQLLAPHSYSFLKGAWWMGRIGVSTIREPWGTVLIIAPSNYPLLLPGVQIVQALVAGNAVLVKPAPGHARVLQIFKQCLVDAGVPEGLVQILPTSIEAAQAAISAGVDKVVLTGSVESGRAVLRETAESITPATVELSGCDAVFVLPQANVERAAQAIAYALCLNGGATCIAPRRIFVTSETKGKLCELLVLALSEGDQRQFEMSPEVAVKTYRAVRGALDNGADTLFGDAPADAAASRMQPLVLQNVQPQMDVVGMDLFAPVSSIIQVADMSQAAEANRLCPYALGVSVFGPKTYAEHWAHQLDAGCVVINDIIVPTADPRVSFGGRGHSGFGVTRGPGGLLEMTRPKTICTRKGSWLPHLDKDRSDDCGLMLDLLKLFHSRSLKSRFAALQSVIRRARG